MALPAWATDPSSLLITEAEYEALPAEISKSIEVVNGRVVFCESPTPEHQRVSRNLTMVLLAVRQASPGSRLWSDDVVIAIEITSSDDEVDFNDKRAEYAAQGIPVYLIVAMDGGRIDSVEEHRLDWSGRNYQLAAEHRRPWSQSCPKESRSVPHSRIWNESERFGALTDSVLWVSGWLAIRDLNSAWRCRLRAFRSWCRGLRGLVRRRG